MPIAMTPVHYLRTTVLFAAGALALAGCSTASDTAAAPPAGTPTAQQSLAVEHPWVKANTTGGMTSAFATLVNDTEAPVVLTGTTTEDVAGSVELHETVLNPDTGATAMQVMAEPITIDPGESYMLEPGGDHIMLMDLQCGLYPGDKLDITLQFQDGAEQTLTAAIRDYAGAQEEYAPGEEPAQENHQEHGDAGHATSSTAADLPSCHA